MTESSRVATRPSPGTYEFEPSHTSITVVGRHLGGLSRVRVTFKGYRANIEVGEKLEDSKVEVWLEAGSLDSGFEMRDGHLKSPDFLDVEQYPEVHFVSTSLEPAGDDAWDLRGELTIRDITRPLTLSVEFTGQIDDTNFQTKRAGFVASGEVNREDYGMEWNMPAGLDGLLVGKKATIEIETEALLTPYVNPMANAGDE